MLLTLGMSLSWQALDRRTAWAIVPVLAIQLVLQPLLALLLAESIGLTGDYRIGAILEAAMPSMVLGIVLCDRYGLDARYYSLIVTISTVLSLATLPVWLYLLTGN
jgi:predicted permease